MYKSIQLKLKRIIEQQLETLEVRIRTNIRAILSVRDGSYMYIDYEQEIKQ